MDHSIVLCSIGWNESYVSFDIAGSSAPYTDTPVDLIEAIHKSVVWDAGLTLKQHRVSVPFLLGILYTHVVEADWHV